jgi:hypothetical protein
MRLVLKKAVAAVMMLAVAAVMMLAVAAVMTLLVVIRAGSSLGAEQGAVVPLTAAVAVPATVAGAVAVAVIVIVPLVKALRVDHSCPLDHSAPSNKLPPTDITLRSPDWSMAKGRAFWFQQEQGWTYSCAVPGQVYFDFLRTHK